MLIKLTRITGETGEKVYSHYIRSEEITELEEIPLKFTFSSGRSSNTLVHTKRADSIPVVEDCQTIINLIKKAEISVLSSDPTS